MTRVVPARLFAVLSIASLVVCARPIAAADLRNVITDFTITSWNEKDGLPTATIWALAQDRDGYLWVGTREGLQRFDGARFTPWEAFSAEALPRGPVRALLVTRDGALWIGFGTDGQIVRVENGHVTSVGGLGRGIVFALTEDREGVVWAAGEGGLAAFEQGRWTTWKAEHGLPPAAVLTVFVDRGGNLFAASDGHVYERRHGAKRFERVAALPDVLAGFAETPDGGVWVTDPTVGYMRLAAASGAQTVTRQGRGVRMVTDRKGNLWIGTGGQGLWRARNASASSPIFERATSLSGLLGDGVYALLEDRDGNIWAGTTEGLNRLTPRTIEQIIDVGLVRGLANESDGGVWIRTVDKLYAYAPTGSQRREVPIPPDARAMATDGEALWVATPGGLFRVDRQGQTKRVSWTADPRQAGAIESLLTDGTGGLWFVTAGHQIVHWTVRQVRTLALPDDVARAKTTAAFVDSARRAWFAFDNGRVIRATADGGIRVLPVPADPDTVFRTIHEDRHQRMWLGGTNGIGAFDHDRFVMLSTSPRFNVPLVTAIVTDERGGVWLGSSVGVVHVTREEFDRAVQDPEVRPHHAIYTRSDGIAGTPVAVGLNQGALRAVDGRLWFVTTRGVTVVDPHVIAARQAPAPVRFERALADDRWFAPGAALDLPAGTRKLEIDYTVVNLTAPLRTRFRYRLDPFDPDWVEAGTRRQAFYTNLRPGRYVFHAVATDSAAGTSSTEAAWAFTVAPMFYQTSAFWALASVSLGLLVVAGWRLRERHLRKQFALIISERARLGREIHDTLLQGLVALAFQFDSLAHDLAPVPRLQDRFVRLRDRIEEYIREARRSIWDLHTQPAHRNLVDTLRRAGEFATDGSEIAFSLQIEGTPFPCSPPVEEQLIRIAQEAAINSVRHASPRKLRIELVYGDASVTLRVVDDGRGFDSGEAQGALHFGITSMHDRARSVGGALTLVTAPGRGTEVTAVLPIAS